MRTELDIPVSSIPDEDLAYIRSTIPYGPHQRWSETSSVPVGMIISFSWKERSKEFGYQISVIVLNQRVQILPSLFLCSCTLFRKRLNSVVNVLTFLPLERPVCLSDHSSTDFLQLCPRLH